MIDSLSSVSTQSLYSENDQEYARPLMRLRDIAEKNDATFLVIHHSSSQGTARGSTAIYNSVDQVWKLDSVGDDPRDCKRILTIEKTRSREPGRYQLEYDPNTWGWNIKGMLLDVDGEEQVENYSHRELSIIRFFRDNAGTPFEVQELSEILGFASDSLRRDLGFLSRRGLISKQQKPGSRANWYFVGELKLIDRSDRSDRPIVEEKSENPKTKFFQNSAIASIGSPKLPPEASEEPIAKLRSVTIGRSVDEFSGTPTQQELQPKNDKKGVLQITHDDLSGCNEISQNTPQAIMDEPIMDEPIENVRSVDFDKLEVGDILFDRAGKPHQLTKRNRQLWKTHREKMISRNDVRIGEFHHATVEDIANLVQWIIQSKDLNQFQWLCKVYGSSPQSLMAKAVDKYPELSEVYNIEEVE